MALERCDDHFQTRNQAGSYDLAGEVSGLIGGLQHGIKGEAHISPLVWDSSRYIEDTRGGETTFNISPLRNGMLKKMDKFSYSGLWTLIKDG